MSDERKTQSHRLRNEATSGASSTAEPRSASAAAEPGPPRVVPGHDQPERKEEAAGVYFFPGEYVTATEARRLLASDVPADRARVVSRLLTYAEYAEIWTWVDRETVRELWNELSLPERLRAAWARNLGLA